MTVVISVTANRNSLLDFDSVFVDHWVLILSRHVQIGKLSLSNGLIIRKKVSIRI